jgi:DNA polymerase-3 subunit delta
MTRASRPGPVVAIVGEDSFLAEEALERTLAAAIGEDRAPALQVLYGDEKKWEDVLATARTGSLFVTRRAIVVRRAELLKYATAPQGDEDPEAPARRARAKAGARSEQEPVEAYLSNPPPDVILVLLAGKPDRRRNPWKKLLASASVQDANPKRGRALRAHVEEALRARGLRLAPDALSELLAEVGQDLRRLMGEVEKLEAWAGDRKEITAEDLAAVLGRGLGQPLYLLSDAFTGRDAGTSLQLVERLLGDGEEGLRILATLHRSLRQVRGALSMREARASRAEIGERLLPPNMQFKLDSLLEASRRWTEPELRLALWALGRADRRLKRGADAATTLVAAVAEACGGAAPATSPRRGR